MAHPPKRSREYKLVRDKNGMWTMRFMSHVFVYSLSNDTGRFISESEITIDHQVRWDSVTELIAEFDNWWNRKYTE